MCMFGVFQRPEKAAGYHPFSLHVFPFQVLELGACIFQLGCQPQNPNYHPVSSHLYTLEPQFRLSYFLKQVFLPTEPYPTALPFLLLSQNAAPLFPSSCSSSSFSSSLCTKTTTLSTGHWTLVLGIQQIFAKYPH